MKDDLKKTYRGTTLLNIALSAGVALLTVVVLAENLNIVRALFSSLGQRMNFLSAVLSEKYLVMFVGVIGILIFALLFMAFQRRQSDYVKEIVAAMNEISKGDLNAQVPVDGDDELAYLAASLNTMAEDIQTLIEKERATEKSKNELITNVAHDLRTPLTSILGYLELLDTNTELAPEVRQKYIGVACNKAKRLQDLIEELFGFTKLNYGKMAVTITQVDIVKLLEQLVDEFYPVFEEKQIECEFHSNISSLQMNGDGNLLARLFDNLINNAVKYGSDGKLIRVNIEYKEPVVSISVTNFGYVIPEEEIPLLFNKFYRVEQSRSSNTGGTGLGLAIVKNIVDLHGGTIECRSSLKGTVFEVKLRSDFDINKEQFKTLDGESQEYEFAD